MDTAGTPAPEGGLIPDAADSHSPALVVLDLGGVLIERARPVLLGHAGRLCGVPEAWLDPVFDAVKVDLWSGARGPANAWRQFATAAGVPGMPCPWRDDIPPPGLVALPAVRRVPAWASRAQLAVLSNQRVGWVEPILAGAGVLHLLGPRWISSRTGLVKPAAEAFAAMLSVGVPAERILFVDDQRANLDAAEEFGVEVLHADRAGEWVRTLDGLLGVG